MSLKRYIYKLIGKKFQDDEDSLRERLLLSQQFTGIAHWDFDYEKNTAHRSSNHDALYGYDHVLKTWNFDNFLHHVLPEYHESVMALFKEADETGKMEGEFKIRKVGGELRWFYIRAVTKKNFRGKTLRIVGILQDITDERDLKGQLSLQQKNLQNIFGEAPQFFCILDSNLVYEQVNPAHTKLFNGRNLTGLSVDEAQPELRGSEFIDILKNLFTDPKVIHFHEIPVQIGDRQRYLDMIYTTRLNAAGKVDGIYAMGTDVTERVLAFKAVKTNEEHLRLITDKLPAFISYTDNEGRYRFVNAMYEKWFKKTRNEILGRTRQEITPPEYQFESKPFVDIALGGSPTHHEGKISNDEGKTLSLDIHFIPDLDPETRKVRGMIAVGMDQTDHLRALRNTERAEKELREVFMQAPAPMFLVLGKNHTFALANPPYEELVGREVMGKPLKEVFPENIEIYETILNQVYQTGEPYFITEAPLELLDSNGKMSLRFVNVGYHAYLSDDGKPRGVLGIIQEVTDQVNSVKARDNFMGVASHELKTLLTAMKLQMQMNQKILASSGTSEFDEDRLKKVFAVSIAQVNRLARLVDDMLDVTRVSADKLSMTFTESNLSHLVSETFDSFHPQLKSVGIDLRLLIEDDITASIDEARIEQVLTNLITNVIKYAPHKPLLVELKKVQSSAVLKVKDSGPGIDPSFHEKIFERFERVDQRRDISGIGLGLFITKQIVEAHGGSIVVAGDLGQGTEFTVTLPLCH